MTWMLKVCTFGMQLDEMSPYLTGALTNPITMVVIRIAWVIARIEAFWHGMTIFVMTRKTTFVKWYESLCWVLCCVFSGYDILEFNVQVQLEFSETTIWSVLKIALEKWFIENMVKSRKWKRSLVLLINKTHGCGYRSFLMFTCFIHSFSRCFEPQMCTIQPSLRPCVLWIFLRLIYVLVDDKIKMKYTVCGKLARIKKRLKHVKICGYQLNGRLKYMMNW